MYQFTLLSVQESISNCILSVKKIILTNLMGTYTSILFSLAICVTVWELPGHVPFPQCASLWLMLGGLCHICNNSVSSVAILSPPLFMVLLIWEVLKCIFFMIFIIYVNKFLLSLVCFEKLFLYSYGFVMESFDLSRIDFHVK